MVKEILAGCMVFIMIIAVDICLFRITDQLVDWAIDYLIKDSFHKFDRKISGLTDYDIDIISWMTKKVWHIMNTIVVLVLFYKLGLIGV